SPPRSIFWLAASTTSAKDWPPANSNLTSTLPTSSTDSYVPCNNFHDPSVIAFQMPSRTICQILAFALFAAPTLVAQNPLPAITSITHVTIIDVATGKELPDRKVVLEGDRIVSVDEATSAESPTGRVIDGHGGFLIPGLWDMHVHIQDLEDLPLYIANGV